MRRLVTTAVAIALVGGALGAPAVAAGNDRPGVPGSFPGSAGVLDPSDLLELTHEPVLPVLTTPDAPTATETLRTARRVLGAGARPTDPSPTLALRDLWLHRSRLAGADLRRADALLARPTDGRRDPLGFGYKVPEAEPVCNTRLCVHYVPTGRDAPPSVDWVNQNLAALDSVWTAEVDQLGYRAPLTDGAKGGGPQLDIYLKNLGRQGLYGYCVPERRKKNRTASAYCVLDDDFAPKQFPNATPVDNMTVTAGHEFFHAVQYAYDYAEDPWMMESTATWMEERIATTVNDNRQYLPDSQIYAPNIPLDAFSRTNSFQYGNWVFWEYLTAEYGDGLVLKTWKQAGSLRKDGGKNSLLALKKVLRSKGGFHKNYSRFAAGNLTPAANFPEGAEYPGPQVRGAKMLSKRKRAKRFSTTIDHLASASYVYGPGKGLRGGKWKLRVHVSGPAKRTSPTAVVVVHQLDGKRKVRMARLDRGGDGHLKVPFDNRTVGAVSVTLVNGSTRYRCNRDTLLACAGEPLDDGLPFAVESRVVR